MHAGDDHEEYEGWDEHYATPPRRRGRILLLVVVLAGVAAAGFWYYQTELAGSYDAQAFCSQARRLSSIDLEELERAPDGERGTKVRSAAARLILLNEELVELAPRSLRGEIGSLIEGYRGVVRSGSLAELQALQASGDRTEVADLIRSDC